MTMMFITARELRNQMKSIWGKLKKQNELVITLNGHPIGLLTALDNQNFEETLEIWKQAKALQVLKKIHQKSLELNLQKTSLDEINTEIKRIRQKKPA